MKNNIIIPIAVFVLVFLVEVLHFKIIVMHSNPNWWTFYIRLQHYFITFSMALAFAYGAFAFMKLRSRSKGAIAGTTVVAFLIWFTSCCGAPMLVIILGIMGIKVGSVFLPPIVTTVMTIIFVSIGMIWLLWQREVANPVCTQCCSEHPGQVNQATPNEE